MWNWIKSLFKRKKHQVEVLVPKPIVLTKCFRHIRFIKGCLDCQQAVKGGL
jgi:hypothetical protein